jgi:DnaK suppressor protein
LSVTLKVTTIRAGVDVGVNDQLTAIHTELLQMKEELEARLFEYSFFQQDSQARKQFVSAGNSYVSC